MGLPIRLVVAVNRNDIIHRTVQQGDFSLSEAVEQTLASAMDIQVGPVGKCAGLAQLLIGWEWTRTDISVAPGTLPFQVPYNMERIFWLLSGSNSQVTRALMEQFERTQSVSLPKELHSKVSHGENKGCNHETQCRLENLSKARGHLFLEHLL